MTTVLSLLAVLRRRTRLATVLFVLFALGGVLAVYAKKPVFEASGKLLLNTESLPLSLSRAELPQTAPGMPTVEVISTLIEILTARELMEHLVDDLGVDAFKSPPPTNPVMRGIQGGIEAVSTSLKDLLAALALIEKLSPRDELVQALRARLVVFPVRQSQVVEVALTWPTPRVPQMATARLLDLFLARVDALNALSSEQDIFAGQAERAEQALAAAQTDLRGLQSAHGVVNPTLEIQRLGDRIARNEQALAAPDAAPSGANGASPVEGSRIDDLLRRLSTQEIELAGARARYAVESAVVREATARLSATQAALDRETARIARSLDEDRARLRTLLQIEDRFIAASRTVDAASDALRAYRQAAADRQVMALQQERVRIRVIDAPAYPLQANGPSRLTLLIVAVIGAAVLAAGTTLLIDRWSEDIARQRETVGPGRPDRADAGRGDETVDQRPMLAVTGSKVG